jgi:DNA-binding PadR family transcriptional regulator
VARNRLFASTASPYSTRAGYDELFAIKFLQIEFCGRIQSFIDIAIIDAMPKRKLDPLPSAAFQILLSLAGEDLHGYAIMRQVAEQTDGRMRLGPGTLYSSIATLLEEKLIAEVDERDDPRLGHERRRYYRLTSAGRKLARSEANRLADLLRVARTKKIFRGDYV